VPDVVKFELLVQQLYLQEFFFAGKQRPFQQLQLQERLQSLLRLRGAPAR
jgi:hypothetical protein